MKRPRTADHCSEPTVEPFAAMDVFDIFGSDETASSTTPMVLPLQPRASAHVHFAASSRVWPAGASSYELEAVQTLFKAYVGEHAEPCAKELRKSLSQYGRPCANSVLSIAAACQDGGCHSAKTRELAHVCKELCATAIEEANWDVPAWQEANLLALAVLLWAQLHGDHEADEAKPELIGGLAIALFNLAVSMLSPSSSEPQWIDLISALLQLAEAAAVAAWPECLNTSLICQSGGDVWTIPAEPPPLTTPAIDADREVKTVSVTELPCASFFSEHLQKGTPVLIKGHLKAEQWEALNYFADLHALHKDAGSRLVPISLGSPLVGHGGVVHWPLRKLIEERLLPSNATHCKPPPDGQPLDVEAHCDVAYMSQHHLLHQHPSFQSLLAVPPFTLGRELSPTNVWIGTRGTVTSLHSDPNDNLLCQVAGFKYFRLYGLNQTPKLYATTLRATNTNSFGSSPLRVEMALPLEYADAADAIYVEGILKPGDMLFIPKSVWHYVRSLTTSISVNFWF